MLVLQMHVKELPRHVRVPEHALQRRRALLHLVVVGGGLVDGLMGQCKYVYRGRTVRFSTWCWWGVGLMG